MNTDLIIIALFLITVVYVINRAIASVDNQTKVSAESKDLDTQLEEKTLGETKLKDLIKIKFLLKPEDRFKFSDQPKTLGITIENTSNKTSRPVDVYVDWDKSTVTDYGNASRRVIQLNSSKQVSDVNPPKFQVPSPVPPGNSLTVDITAEPLLGFDKDKGIWEPKKPILDVLGLKDRAKNPKTPKEVKDKWKAFDYRDKPLEFSLRLMLAIDDLTDNVTTRYTYVFWCKFLVKNMHWSDQLPWTPKK